MISVRLDRFPGTVATALLSGYGLEADSYSLLDEARAQAARRGARALVLDFFGVGRVSSSGLGALVELAANRHGPELALCGLPGATVSRLQSLGLDHALPHYPDRDAALASAQMMHHQLAGLRAVVLTGRIKAQAFSASGPGVEAGCVSGQGLTRVLHQLAGAGIGEAVVSVGGLDPIITAAVGNKRFGAMPVFILAEGGEPLGSATTLGRLRAQGNLAGDALVLCGDALSDIDIAALYACHHTTRADVTVAIQAAPHDQAADSAVIQCDDTGRILALPPSRIETAPRPTLRPAGIYILGPRALACADALGDTDIAAHLLPALLGLGMHLQSFGKPFRWIEADGHLLPNPEPSQAAAPQDRTAK